MFTVVWMLLLYSYCRPFLCLLWPLSGLETEAQRNDVPKVVQLGSGRAAFERRSVILSQWFPALPCHPVWAHELWLWVSDGQTERL